MGSPGSRARCFRACSGSQTARGPLASHDSDALGVAFRLSPRRRHPGVVQNFAARYPACTYPCQRFASALAGNPGAPGTAVITKTKPQAKRPNLYRVLILNDDYTPMEFVVHVLERFFSKPREEAVQIMLHVHRHGVGICGVYTFEVAETKVAQVIELARRHQHPLQCTMEKE